MLSSGQDQKLRGVTVHHRRLEIIRCVGDEVAGTSLPYLARLLAVLPGGRGRVFRYTLQDDHLASAEPA